MGIDFSQGPIHSRGTLIPATEDELTAGKVAAALDEWDRRATEGVTSSPREHVEALLCAALNGTPVYRYDPEPECDHIATVTAPLHVTHGQNVYTTDPVTICVTCNAPVDLAPTTEGA